MEPNDEMRAAGEAQLAAFPNFHSVAASAEDTALPAASVDWVVAGQAFHWFNAENAHAEFRRILRAPGHVAICWNERDADGSAFMRAYDELIPRYSPEYEGVGYRNIGKVDYEAFFEPGAWRMDSFPNHQTFDREGLRGRLQSSSYTPAPGSPGYEPMMAELDALYHAHQQDGRVAFTYVTKVYWGVLQPVAATR